MTTLNLAWFPKHDVLEGCLNLKAMQKILSKWNPQEKEFPSLLVSYFYYKEFVPCRDAYCFSNWLLDSGAFSAHNSGVIISLDEYIEQCQHLLKTDKKLAGVFSLDVIGDHKASQRNTDKMWEAGVEAIPVYHAGSPEHVLRDMVKEYDHIAIGGAVGLKPKAKLHFAKRCFELAWPKKIHGLGFGSESILMKLPFHSADASTWQAGPLRFGVWKTYGKMSWRGSDQNLTTEVEWCMNLEKKLKNRWKKEMKLLEEL